MNYDGLGESLAGKRVVLRCGYSNPVECALLAWSERGLEPSYTFCRWRDFESIALMDIKYSDIISLEERGGSVEIQHRNRFERPAVVSPNPAKVLVTKDQLPAILERYGDYSSLLLQAGVKPPNRDVPAGRRVFSIRN